MNSKLAERMRQCAEMAGSGDELSRLTAIPRRTLEYYLTGEREPKVSRCVEIANAVGVDAGWLASGDGPMRKEAIRGGDVQDGAYTAKADEFVYISRLYTAAGKNSEPQLIDSRYAFRADWIRGKGLDASKLALEQAKDAAMRPIINPGDLLLLEVFHHSEGHRIELGLPPGSFPPEDGVYKIRLSGSIATRRLQSDMTGGVYVSADADESLRGRLVPSEHPSFRILAKIVWAGHQVG